MKVVITYGTFDLFHVGHVRLLKRLKNLGDKLIVGISSDEFNKLKGKESFFSYEERSEIVKACQFVDDVFPEECWEQKKNDIIKYNADIFAMGDDWKFKFDHLNSYCNVIYLPRTEDISTTDIKNKLSEIKKEDLEKVIDTLSVAMSVVESLSKR